MEEKINKTINKNNILPPYRFGGMVRGIYTSPSFILLFLAVN